MKTYRIQTIKNQACKSHKCIQFGTLRKKKPERTIKQKKAYHRPPSRHDNKS